MGVKDLLPLLRHASSTVHLQELSGCRVAIDGMHWLYRAAMTCSRAIATGEGPSPAFFFFLAKQIERLFDAGVTNIIVVLDGCECPAKVAEAARRRESRQRHLELALQSAEQGDAQAAERFFQRAVSIDGKIVRAVAEYLRFLRVPYIVAPYEADAQLAYLSHEKLVDVIISEDSDLLAYGCARVLYKLDQDGFGSLVCLEDVFSARPAQGKQSFSGWSREQFVLFCCLLGCDYVDRIRGFGPVKAFELVSACPSFDCLAAHLRTSPHLSSRIEAGYVNALQRAILTYRHHIVYDMHARSVRTLTPFPREHADFLGQFFDDRVAHDLVHGLIDPDALTHGVAQPQRVLAEPQERERQPQAVLGKRPRLAFEFDSPCVSGRMKVLRRGRISGAADNSRERDNMMVNVKMFNSDVRW